VRTIRGRDVNVARNIRAAEASEGSGFSVPSGATDTQVAHQRGHSKVETTKNICGHLFVQDRACVLDSMNQPVSRLYAYESHEPGPGGDGDAAA